RTSQLGETIKLAPASAACLTSSGVNTVPAPTAIVAPNLAASRLMVCNTPGEFNVTSTAVSPPSCIAATISSSRPPKSPRRMAMILLASIRSMVSCISLRLQRKPFANLLQLFDANRVECACWRSHRRRFDDAAVFQIVLHRRNAQTGLQLISDQRQVSVEFLARFDQLPGF